MAESKCDAVLAYCALPMGHAGTHEYPTATLAAEQFPIKEHAFESYASYSVWCRVCDQKKGHRWHEPKP